MTPRTTTGTLWVTGRLWTKMEALYPHTEAVALDIAVAMGLMNRNTTPERLQDQIQDCVVKVLANVEDDYVQALEKWLGTLTKEQREILADGEEEEMAGVLAYAPVNQAGENASDLLESIWLMMDERIP